MSQEFENRYERTGVGKAHLLDLTEYQNRRIKLRFVMATPKPESSRCHLGAPELLRDDEVVYDFARAWELATLHVRDDSGSEQTMGGWDTYYQRSHYANGALSPTGSLAPVLFAPASHFGETIKERSLVMQPPNGVSWLRGSLIATYTLSHMLMQVEPRGLSDPGLGGARYIGVAGSRAPCPLDGTAHTIRFRAYARAGHDAGIRYAADHTSADQVPPPCALRALRETPRPRGTWWRP